MSDRRAVVVGIGVVAPCGAGVDRFWEGLLAGRSYASTVELRGDGRVLPQCALPDDDWMESFSRGERRRLDRIGLLGLAAADEAVATAGLDDLGVAEERRGFVAGVGFGGILTLTAQQELLQERGSVRVSPFAVAAAMPSTVAAYGSIRYQVRGPTMTVASACASGTQSIAEGARLIADDSADVVIAGGAEAPLADLPFACFARMDAMSTAGSDPRRASRPFDARRAGFVLGEGAGFVVLAAGEVVRRTDVRPIAEVAGWSVTSDAHHITAPNAHASGPRRCLEACLARASCAPVDIGHVNAHGTGTRLNDAVEAEAITSVFGGGRVPVTSHKGAIGHLMGGAGAVEAVGALRGLETGLVPPTVNCEEIDPALDIDVVRLQPRDVGSARPVVSCSFGFGGQNCAIVLAPFL